MHVARKRFASRNDLHREAVQLLEMVAMEAIEARGAFTLALSGGRTPVPFYRRLAKSQAVNWRDVHLFWSDERGVPPDHPTSNYGTAKDALIDRIPIPPENVHRIHSEQTPQDAAEDYEAELRRELGPEGRLDLVLLGMGADGHTASLFPGHMAVEETDLWVLPVHAPVEPPWRVTLALPLLNRARNVLFLVVGEEKTEALLQIADGADLPASRVRPSNGTLTWFVCLSND